MSQITIDREGAQALFDIIDADPGRPVGVLRALRRAADGDFADLAALMGTREVARAPVEDYFFRVGDVVSHFRMGTGWPVVEVYDGGVNVSHNPVPGPTYCLRDFDCILTHRRHFKAGERCPVTDEGQQRTHNGASGVVTWVDTRYGSAEITYDNGHRERFDRRELAEETVLAADWSADAAVLCEVGA